MSREVALFVFALAAIPVATFFWDTLWGFLTRKRGVAVDGIKSSWKRALVVSVIAVFALLWLNYDNRNTERQIEQRNTALIEAFNQRTQETIERLDRLIEIVEANSGTSK